MSFPENRPDGEENRISFCCDSNQQAAKQKQWGQRKNRENRYRNIYPALGRRTDGNVARFNCVFTLDVQMKQFSHKTFQSIPIQFKILKPDHDFARAKIADLQVEQPRSLFEHAFDILIFRVLQPQLAGQHPQQAALKIKRAFPVFTR